MQEIRTRAGVEPARVTIAGYYGARNTGDEAILAGMVRSLRNEGIRDLTVLSWDPEATRRMHGVKSLSIGRRLEGLGPLLGHLKHTDLFLLGGGGLLQDSTFRVVPFWLSRVVLALASRTPVMYCALGVGPLTTRFGRRVVGSISNRVKRVTVRDPASETLLRTCGVRRPPVEVTADPALCLQIPASGRSILEREGIGPEEGALSIAVCLRSWKACERLLPSLTDCLIELGRALPIRYVFIPFQDHEDRTISEQVLRGVASIPSRYESRILRFPHTAEEVAAILSGMDGVIAMRLHAVVLGALSHVPAFGIADDPKVRRFMERAAMPSHGATFEELRDRPAEVASRLESWIGERERLRERMKPAVDGMIRDAKRNAAVARQLLNRESGLDSEA